MTKKLSFATWSSALYSIFVYHDALLCYTVRCVTWIMDATLYIGNPKDHSGIIPIPEYTPIGHGITMAQGVPIWTIWQE